MMDVTDQPGEGPCRRVAAAYGIDMSQIDYLLTLSPQERLKRHEQARSLVMMLRQASREHYGIDLRNSESTSRSPS